MSTNNDGQPINRAFSSARVTDRKIDELIGVCKGILANGAVDQAESEFLLAWLEQNKSVSNQWPANVLYHRVREMLEDNILDEAEEKELLETLLDVTGGAILGGGTNSEPGSTLLPLCSPPPEVVIEDSTFCFTGKFASGARSQMEGAAKENGALIASKPTRNTDYLVIGSIGSSDWLHSTHGRKIERAVELRDEGQKIQIISEEHWLGCVPIGIRQK